MGDFSLVFVNGQKNLYFYTRIWGVKNIQNLASKDTAVQETNNDIYPVTQLQLLMLVLCCSWLLCWTQFYGKENRGPEG